MITIRHSAARGKANFDWLDTKHTFSFGSYYDPSYMGFQDLRVINEDIIKPSRGFGVHSHQDMEIITYILEGELQHKDSIGNGSIIRPGDVQRMSAGSGISHSEFNASDTNLVHLLQIWIKPNETGIPPSYEQKHFSMEEKQGKLKLVASSDGRDNSVKIHQNADVYVTVLNEGDRLDYDIKNNRAIWIQIARGSVKINGEIANIGDGVAITEESKIELLANNNNTEILLFDLP